MAERIHAYQGIDNFRDYGGYVAMDGRRIRPGRLLRSAALSRATDADLQRFAGLECAVVVDLRRPAEREREPSRRPEDWAGLVIENDEGDEEGEPPHIRALRDGGLSIQAVDDYLHTYYANAPWEPRHIDLFSRYFDVLARGYAPVLIHCAAGKDRTGILAALTHQALGVSKEDTVADYLLTNDAARIEERTPEVQARLSEAFGFDMTAEAVRAFLGVKADYLQTAFDTIEARHGSINAYLENVLQVTPERREKIADRLLE